MIDGTVAHVWVTRCFAFNFREARVKLCTLKVCIQDVFIFFLQSLHMLKFTFGYCVLSVLLGYFFSGYPNWESFFFTRGRKVYDSQVIFARETSPSWKGKLYVSFYIRNFACKCIPKWISKKIVVLNIFEQFFSSMLSVFSRSFQFFFYEIQIRFHSTKKSWTETYIWLQYCTCVFPC